jgi:hypothetical protein
MRISALFAASGLLLLPIGACTGLIDDPARGAVVDPTLDGDACNTPNVARRLSRTEYDNTLRDLFPFDVGTPSETLPDDVAGVNGLTVSDRFLEQHAKTVERLAALAIENSLITCDPNAAGERACAREVLAPFMERAWRRPVTPGELDAAIRYRDIVAAEPDEPEPFRQAMDLAIRATLLSPNFLFRFEPTVDPASAASEPLGDYQLASRLSYFLWETMPDDELFAAAREGSLSDTAVLEAQVERMLDDPRTQTLVDRLAREWLSTERVDYLTPSPTLYPDFDPALLDRMKQETALFIGEFLRDDRNFREMFDADFTYADATLARHYGLPGADELSDELTRVSLADVPERGGLLTQGAVLVATSVPRNDPTAEVSETNIIVRGEFVLRHLLCQHLPPPPEGLDFTQIQADAQRDIPDTAPRKVREGVRQGMQPCSNCHSYIDPIGFSMEHYDPSGAWRETDTLGTEVDSTGVLLGADGLPVGEFDGARSLGTLLARDTRVSQCLTETVLSVALGRNLNGGDQCLAEKLAEQSDAEGNGLRSLLRSIVLSEAFTRRGGEAP